MGEVTLLSVETITEIVKLIRARWQDAQAIYLFGSAADGSELPGSDIDLAVLSPNKPVVEQVIKLKAELSRLTKKDIDLIDLRRADTVTAVQIVYFGRLLFSENGTYVAAYATTTMSKYALLNEERREIIEQIQAQGSIYG